MVLATTHSPIVVSSCEKGNLIRIEDNQEVSYQPDTYMYSGEAILVSCRECALESKDIKISIVGLE